MSEVSNSLATDSNGIELTKLSINLNTTTEKVNLVLGNDSSKHYFSENEADEIGYENADDTLKDNADDTELQILDTDAEIEKAPDGGWGWLIVLGSFVVHVLIGGFYRSNGVLYLQMKERYNRSATATAWVLSVFSTVRLSFAPLASAVCNRYSVRYATILGSAICTIGVLISAYVPDIYYLYLTYGFLGGLGRAFTYAPGLVIVGHYFNKRRGIAVGLATSGVGLGSFTFPPLIEIMFNTYGFSGTFLILSAVTANFFVCGALFRPLDLHRKLTKQDRYRQQQKVAAATAEQVEDLLPAKVTRTPLVRVTSSPTPEQSSASPTSSSQERNGVQNAQLDNKISFDISNSKLSPPEKKPLFDLTLFRNYAFLALCLQLFFYTLSFNTTFVFLPALAKEKGISQIEGAYMVSILGICDMFSRITMSALLDLKRIKPYRLILYNVVMFVNAGVSLLLPSMTSFWHFAIVCGLYGIMSGTYISQKSVVLVDIVGVENLTNGFGLMLVFQGLGSLVGPTVGGLLKDFLGSYDMAFYFGTIGIVGGGLMMGSGNIWTYRRRRLDTQSGKH